MLYDDERPSEIWVEIFRELKLLKKEELKLVFFWLMMDFAALFGILFALIVFHQPLLRDLYNCDMRDRDPFNLQDGWLLWAIIGVIFAITAKFGTTFATKYFSKRWPQPKTKDSIDTGQDQLTGSPKRRILMWSVMVALLLPPVVEEYVYGGYLMASLTKWLATTIVVVFSSFVFASVHWNSKQQVSHLFVGALAFGLTCAKTHTPMTAVAMHILLCIVYFFVIVITFMRRSFSRGIMLLQPAKEVSYRAKEVSYRVGIRRHKNYGNKSGSRIVFQKKERGNKR